MRRYLYLSLLVAVGLFAIAGIAAATDTRPADAGRFRRVQR